MSNFDFSIPHLILRNTRYEIVSSAWMGLQIWSSDCMIDICKCAVETYCCSLTCSRRCLKNQHGHFLYDYTIMTAIRREWLLHALIRSCGYVWLLLLLIASFSNRDGCILIIQYIAVYISNSHYVCVTSNYTQCQKLYFLKNICLLLDSKFNKSCENFVVLQFLDANSILLQP